MTILTKSAKTWTFLLFLVNWLNPEHLCFKLNAPFLIDNKVEFAKSLRSKDKCYKLQLLYKKNIIKHSFEGFNQFSTTMALAELQATEALKFPFRSFQSAENYLSEMNQTYTTAGDMTLLEHRIIDF